MINKLSTLLAKYREPLLYLVFGVMTTLVDFVVFLLAGLLLGEELYLLSNFIAWCFAVAFAFLVNKIIVFSSHSVEAGTLLREIFEFVSARVFSFAVEELGFFLLVDVFAMGAISIALGSIRVTGQIIAKAVLAVIVVILNYFFSKFVIFAKQKQ